MRVIATLCLSMLLLPLYLGAVSQDSMTVDIDFLNPIRKGFYTAVDNEDTTANLMKFIKDNFSSNHKDYPPVILAYYATLEGLLGRHASNPFSKYAYVSRAIEKINHAVETDPDLLEGRFLRFSFFHQIPGIFGMGGKVPEDLRRTIDMLEKRDYSFVDRQMQKDMVDYLLGTDRLDTGQRKRLEELASEFNGEQ